MQFFLDDSTIIACSTGNNSNTAIGVIRLSGFDSINSFQDFFSIDLSTVKPRFAYRSDLLEGKNAIDNILFTYFPENASYNGENILELSVHGNQLNISRIMNMFIETNLARMAGPGEFTYRALKHGKLSISQVEGLDMLLNANSNLMLEQGLEILQGELHQKYISLYDSFIRLKGSVEICIDFSDDVGEEQSRKMLLSNLKTFGDQLLALHARTQGQISGLLSSSVVICGETNAGKSSLFNLLLKHNRSIVSSIAGTTRDYVSENISIQGINFRLVDTAGIRTSDDSIENIGIDRSFEVLNTAFYKILVINPLISDEKYLEKFSEIHFDLIIFSHADSPLFIGELQKINHKILRSKKYICASFASGSIEPLIKFGPIEPVKKSAPIEPKSKSGPIEPVMKNAPIEPLLGSGPIEPVLKQNIVEKYEAASANNPILLERHRACINKICSIYMETSYNLSNLDDIAIISSEVNILGGYLSELVGIVSPDDVLNSVFSNFCIGK